VNSWITKNPRDAAHTCVALVSLSLIGAGLWVELRAWAFVVIGTLLLAGVVYARTRG